MTTKRLLENKTAYFILLVLFALAFAWNSAWGRGFCPAAGLLPSASVSIASGPTLPPPVDENVRIASGPTLPPPVDENVRIASGPTLPPPVDENVRIASGPTLPPPVDENVRITA